MLSVDKTKLASLVERVLNGETQVYEAIYLATKDNIYFHAKTVLQSEESAWDVVQDTYAAAFRSLEKLNSPETAETWLCAIAGNLCFSRLRKLKHADAAEPADLPDDDADEDTVYEFVTQQLDTLDDMQRISLTFRYCDNMSLAQIGSIMRCGENTVKTKLEEAEKLMNISRDSNSRGISPAQLRDALERMKENTQLSPAITLSIGSAVAQKCGYSSNLRITTSAGKYAPHEREALESIRRERMNIEEDEDEERPRHRGGISRHRSSILAYGLVIMGVVVGAIAFRGIMDHNSSEVLPDNVYTQNGEVRTETDTGDETGEAVSGESGISSACAQAYIGVISDYTGRYGVCTSQTDGQGLAYAALLDFDGDGQSEMYLYYVDQNFSEDNQAISHDDNGQALLCVHEELWGWDGEIKLLYSQDHCTGGSTEDGTGAGRWIIADGAKQLLVSWYSYTDENGYINQILKNYALIDGELTESVEASGMFVVANAANQRRDGYLIEEYYGTDSAHFDDVGYFVEGAVTDDEGRKSCTYETYQALLDIGTSDIVPLNDSDETSPVAILKDSYDARKQTQQLIIPEGLNGSGTIAWQCSDINEFISNLATLCTAES